MIIIAAKVLTPQFSLKPDEIAIFVDQKLQFALLKKFFLQVK